MNTYSLCGDDDDEGSEEWGVSSQDSCEVSGCARPITWYQQRTLINTVQQSNYYPESPTKTLELREM